MGNSQQGAAVSGDKPSCRVGDVVRALHPGLQSFCRARVTEVRRYRVQLQDESVASRWIVRVRWAEYWMDEPDATAVVEPTILGAASVPHNRHLSFVQIVANPFPYYPQFSEVLFQPAHLAVTAASTGGGGGGGVNAHTWAPGFVVEENEHQYRVEYLNSAWKPHPLLALEEGEDEEDQERREAREQAERARIKAQYKDDLIRAKLRRDARKREARRVILQAEVDAARLEVAQAQAAVRALEGEDDVAADDAKHAASGRDPALMLQQAQTKLTTALAALNSREMVEDDDAVPDDDDDDDSDTDGAPGGGSGGAGVGSKPGGGRALLGRPSISHQPDTSLIYKIDYQSLDPLFIYDADLEADERDNVIDEGDDGLDDSYDDDGYGGGGGGGGDGRARGGHNAGMSEAEILEMEMQRTDPAAESHPSQWLNEQGEERFAAHAGNGGAHGGRRAKAAKKKAKKKKKAAAASKKPKPSSPSDENAFGKEDFYDDHDHAALSDDERLEEEEGEDDDDGDDGEEEDGDDGEEEEEDGDGDEDSSTRLGGGGVPPHLRPPSGRLGLGDPMRTLEAQQELDEWEMHNPRFVAEWVNKYSTRLKRQTDFFNTLYAKYLQGIYEESLDDKLFRIQQKKEAMMEAERAKPKKWYKPKRDVEGDADKLMAQVEAAAMQEEQNQVLRDDTFDEDDTGLEVVRRERYERVVEQGNKWFIEESIQMDGVHITEMAVRDGGGGAGGGGGGGAAASGSSIVVPTVKHKRKIHERDQDDVWDSFMLDAWVRYRYEYRDPDHPDFHARGGNKAAGSGSGAAAIVPRKQRWIWATVLSHDKDEMVLQLRIPEALRKHAWASSNAGGRKNAAAASHSSLAHSKRLSTSGAVGGGPDKVTLHRDNELLNARLIKFYHDRVRRWSMDCYRRYQLELATQGLFLCFVNRVAVEANEDADETERELNAIMVNAIVMEKEKQQMALLAPLMHMGPPGQSPLGVGPDGQHVGAAHPHQLTRQARFNNRRGSVAPRGSIFAQLDGGAMMGMGMGFAPTQLGFGDVPPAPGSGDSLSQKLFSSNHMTAESGYGIFGYDDMREDGNSLYRAVSLQLFGTQENWAYIKRLCLQHIAAHQSYFSLFLDINFEYYLALKFRSLDPEADVVAQGDHLDLQAVCEIFDVAVHVYSQVELGVTSMATGNTNPAAMEAAAAAATAAAMGETAAAAAAASAYGGGGADRESSFSASSSGSSSGSSGGLLQHHPLIRFYDDVNPDGSKLPTICLSYAGYGHYDAIKRRTTPWPLQSALGFPVYTRTRIGNIVLRARQRTEFEAIERVRVEEARRAYELITTATANAPMGRSRASRAAIKARRKEKLRRDQDRAAAVAHAKSTGARPPIYAQSSSSSDEGDATLESVIASMSSRVTRQIKPVDTHRMEVMRTILQARELMLCTYIGEVQFSGDVHIQTAQFLDCLASAHLEYGSKKLLLATGYHVQQTWTHAFYHDMHIQSMNELVSRQNLEGLAAVAMFGQEDGAGGATTTTGEGLKLNLPRVVVMYPYWPNDAHLDEDEMEEVARARKGQVSQTGAPPLMLIEGVQLAVEEMVRLVRRLAKSDKLKKTSQATWLPPC